MTLVSVSFAINSRDAARSIRRLIRTAADARPVRPLRGPGRPAWAHGGGSGTGRTLARHFEAELGMSLWPWHRSLRLFKAVELLDSGLGDTQTAIELG
jgi:hypothetical protein